MKWFYHSNLTSCGAVQSALGVGGCDRKIVVLAMCSLQFAKAGSAATLPRQEKSNSADIKWGGFVPRGDVLSMSSSRLPIAPRRARNRLCMIESQLRSRYLRHKTSAWATI
jgi:hypothetical protein